MIKKKCPICHKTFYAKEADIARGWAKCCSKYCAAKLREKKHKKEAKATEKKSRKKETEEESTFEDHSTLQDTPLIITVSTTVQSLGVTIALSLYIAKR